MRRCMNVGGLKLPVATSTTPPRIPPSLPHQRIRESDDSRVHPSRDLNKQRPDFCYLLSSIDNLSLGRGTSTPTSSIAGERVAGGARRAPCPWCGAAVGESRRSVGSAAGPSTKQCLLVFWASMGQSLLIVDWKAHEESILGLGPCKVHLRTNTLPVTP